MIRTAAAILLGLALAHGQQDHQHIMSQQPDRVMGFSQEKTTHHFQLTSEGGVIEVRANDVKDAESRDRIRGHFKHITQTFGAGDFDDPMLAHHQIVPGTTTMSRLKADIHWEFQEIGRGARINIVADNKEALDAVHEFLRFQIADHKTGDCTAIR